MTQSPLLPATFLLNALPSPSRDKDFCIVIHGGAGAIQRKNISPDRENEYREKLTESVTAGYSLLQKGRSAIEAVVAAIKVMEDSPLFNAGKGAVFTHEETNELDASIMDGTTLEAGAVAGVSVVKNPIELAVRVMNNSPHVLLSGKGAEDFAKTEGLTLVSKEYFFAQRRYDALLKARAKQKTELDHDWNPSAGPSKYGTVGAVALDRNGNLAAGTSTGGLTNKRWNRIGDSSIIGAGTYANNQTCAVSGTGKGEFFIRGVAAYDISALISYKGLSLQEAVCEVVYKKLPSLGGQGGVIAVDRAGNVSMEFNTPGMFRAYMSSDSGDLTLGIFEKNFSPGERA